eukprot:GHUV01018682.1.p1 GENE.GHUV01018682.1~~GHUV01018682.1.p1  ORF type:complete len:147 (+),score=12.20 GHUV01018682.1:308-748(+)
MTGGAAFVYGTLMAPEVLNLLIKRVPPHKPAKLSGYSRYRVKGQVFPAILHSTPQSQVQGMVLMELTPQELHILDVYESEEYYRERVSPELEDGTTVPADVYVWRDEYRSMLDGAWSYEEWRKLHLHKWIAKLSPGGGHPSGELLN